MFFTNTERETICDGGASLGEILCSKSKNTIFLINKNTPQKRKLLETLDLRVPRIPRKNEKNEKMKIVRDFGLEVTKNTSPPPEMKIVRNFLI